MIRCWLAGSNSLEFASFNPHHVARKLDASSLHAEADSKIRHLLFARIADGVQHALDAALAKSPGTRIRRILLTGLHNPIIRSL